MATGKTKSTSTRKKGRVKPNVPRAGLSVTGARYGCGGKKRG